mmetsp:Transcript_16520/g.50607  ORF Transcript_16520/g.50607 Transcript_16520/m.50607 type:complete len:295 (-) Transcript_16520:4088-4972(-)
MRSGKSRTTYSLADRGARKTKCSSIAFSGKRQPFTVSTLPSRLSFSSSVVPSPVNNAQRSPSLTQNSFFARRRHNLAVRCQQVVQRAGARFRVPDDSDGREAKRGFVEAALRVGEATVRHCRCDLQQLRVVAVVVLGEVHVRITPQRNDVLLRPTLRHEPRAVLEERGARPGAAVLHAHRCARAAVLLDLLPNVQCQGVSTCLLGNPSSSLRFSHLCCSTEYRSHADSKSSSHEGGLFSNGKRVMSPAMSESNAATFGDCARAIGNTVNISARAKSIPRLGILRAALHTGMRRR